MFKPMLASKAEDHEFCFPLFASAKLDGLRGTVHAEGLRSRSMKPFTNKATADFFGDPALIGFDGELIVGLPNAADVFRKSTSELRNSRFDPRAVFYVFDLFNYQAPYTSRYQRLQEKVAALPARFAGRVVVLPQMYCASLAELLQYEERCLQSGYEGLITRTPFGGYKQGRSTVREQTLLKVKRFEDSEAELLGIVEQCENQNPQMTNEVGRSHRSHHQENMVPKGTMGAVVVRDKGVVFSIGTGFDDAERARVWSMRNGKVITVDAFVDDKVKKITAYAPKQPGISIKYKFFRIGTVFRPRHPVYLGERISIDL